MRAGLLAAAVAGIIALFAPRGGTGTSGLAPERDRKSLPGFRLRAVSGPPWSLEENRGHVVLLNFWATWCPPCRMETPELVRAATRYEPEGLRIAGITMDDNPGAVVPDFVKRYRIPYPILVPDEGLPLASAIESLPTTVLLDRHGRVARVFVGAVHLDDLSNDIEQLLRERM